jgi:Primosomal protein N'' (replication factor Y) - superfamily II helicase
MDADSMTRKEAYRETLRNFRTGKIDILVGTQMIAKGLHFPNVTLVGIINADLALHLPDFRAGERTFQLLTQVAGTRRPRRDTRRSFRANLHAVQSLDSICATP